MAPLKKRRSIPAFVISGTSSGSGKTLISLGIMEALRRRGLIVQPFKAGPDYIDPGLHSILLGRPSYNLDTWMMGAKGVRKTFCAAASRFGCAVVEGRDGPFRRQGRDSKEPAPRPISQRRSACRSCSSPTLRGSARAMGAVVKGFETFDESVSVKWVIFNKVGSRAPREDTP